MPLTGPESDARSDPGRNSPNPRRARRDIRRSTRLDRHRPAPQPAQPRRAARRGLPLRANARAERLVPASAHRLLVQRRSARRPVRPATAACPVDLPSSAIQLPSTRQRPRAASACRPRPRRSAAPRSVRGAYAPKLTRSILPCPSAAERQGDQLSRLLPHDAVPPCSRTQGFAAAGRRTLYALCWRSAPRAIVSAASASRAVTPRAGGGPALPPLHAGGRPAPLERLTCAIASSVVRSRPGSGRAEHHGQVRADDPRDAALPARARSHRPAATLRVATEDRPVDDAAVPARAEGSRPRRRGRDSRRATTETSRRSRSARRAGCRRAATSVAARPFALPIASGIAARRASPTAFLIDALLFLSRGFGVTCALPVTVIVFGAGGGETGACAAAAVVASAAVAAIAAANATAVLVRRILPERAMGLLGRLNPPHWCQPSIRRVRTRQRQANQTNLSAT
jgi:hypothetical protein